MKQYDVECTYCKHMNRHLYLEETDGWMECEKCGQISRMRRMAQPVWMASHWVDSRQQAAGNY